MSERPARLRLRPSQPRNERLDVPVTLAHYLWVRDESARLGISMRQLTSQLLKTAIDQAAGKPRKPTNHRHAG